jgi:sec-independent protein translocase protein TatA
MKYMSFFLFFNFSTGEIIVIFGVLLLFFGAKRIPELAKGLGKGIREFKDASSGIRKEIDDLNNSSKKEDSAS